MACNEPLRREMPFLKVLITGSRHVIHMGVSKITGEVFPGQNFSTEWQAM